MGEAVRIARSNWGWRVRKILDWVRQKRGWQKCLWERRDRGQGMGLVSGRNSWVARKNLGMVG
jgi:hypothetical protein